MCRLVAVSLLWCATAGLAFSQEAGGKRAARARQEGVAAEQERRKAAEQRATARDLRSRAEELDPDTPAER